MSEYPDVSGGGVPYPEHEECDCTFRGEHGECDCPEDETRYIDYPSPHDDDCDCEACVTFYAERNKS